MNNQINYLADIHFPEDIIFNSVNKGSLSNDDNIEDPEDPFEVTQYLEERWGHESNLEEEDTYEAISTATDHDIFRKNTVRLDNQVKFGIESRFYIYWNQFKLYDVVKERTWD